ncbi:Pentatricopeptide repeat-containing protein, chloroplastic [Colletotrichum chlorophyti]|uniref:Pentatricopeptide repeat-containing protein, chloroplastic n=1 Tax=Colletotrichum chlorophyti TaxID=708187 RepID=A0A1Q8S853_9PEZI|nr:Pentatricopeptide repeat-containing protein, chloroplastic [Colletotrichum chlorophyti]
MLERTAATLESCTSLHALPSATRTLRSRRKLHTGFWQHGAAAIDITGPLLHISTYEPELHASDQPSPPTETLAASTFLLDFLYPNGTAAFLRRAAPGLSDRHSSALHRLPRRSRPFSSSTVEASTPVSRFDALKIADDTEASLDKRAEPDGEDIEEEDEIDVASSADTHSGPSFAGYGSRPDLMEELMASTTTEYFGSVWHLYTQLEPHLQSDFRLKVIAYLYRSENKLDARRVVLLFSQIDISEWTPAVLTSAVAAHLRLGRQSEAVKLFLAGLDERSLVGGLDDLLSHAFKNADWKTVRHVWSSHHHAYERHQTRHGRLERLSAIPNLGALVIDFAKELRKERDTPEELETLLRRVATRALQQPCRPEEALPLLKIINRLKWYTIYLSTALAQGQHEGLPEIYRLCRSFPDAKPSWAILHGMFDVFYPNDVAGLEQIYEDFHTTYGGLDKWGYQKFLKFYASRGDIKSLERMWENYTVAYKHRKVLQKPETFNYIVNAYANLGDFEGARRVFDTMSSKYGVVPNIESWNQLLKSCLQVASYDRARQLFDELCEATEPDAVSFATIMSMAASKGDLEYTLSLFKQVEESQVKVDIHILHAVVRAYCQNGKFREALATCVEAKKRDIPGEHAKLWNLLLGHHSERRAFGAVRHVAKIMAEHDVQWTSDTYNMLLRSLVRCKQTHHAYRLLERARLDHTFKLTPEHFSTVMKGTLRNRQLNLAAATDNLRRKMKIPASADVRITQVSAMIKQQLFSSVEDANGFDAEEELMSYIRQLAEDVNADPRQPVNRDGDAQGSIKRADSLHRLRQVLAEAIRLFTRYGDFESVKELQKLQTSITPKTLTESVSELSLEWLHSTLRENVQGKKFDAAKETWERIWVQTLALSRPATYKGQHSVLPRYRYSLSKPFSLMREVFTEENDPAGLKALINKIIAEGFALYNPVMNHAIQALARMGNWFEACELCEEHLMPNWTGWQFNRIQRNLKRNLPLEERRVGSAPSRLRPTSYTLTILIKEYRELKGMAPWSSSAAERTRIIKDRCPRVVDAFDSMSYSGVGIEREVFSSKSSGKLQRGSGEKSSRREAVVEGGPSESKSDVVEVQKEPSSVPPSQLVRDEVPRRATKINQTRLKKA